MKQRDFIEFMHVIEKLKCNTRHSWTSSGRRESVAEHTWRLSVMAMLCRDEYPELDMDRVIKMCLVHDFGEALTGDVPSFYKTDEDRKKEDEALATLVNSLPEPYRTELGEMFAEMAERKTPEAKLVKALDNMEAVISHNEAPISTWLPLEYTENIAYGEKTVAWSEWTTKLKEELNEDSRKKIEAEGAH